MSTETRVSAVRGFPAHARRAEPREAPAGDPERRSGDDWLLPASDFAPRHFKPGPRLGELHTRTEFTESQGMGIGDIIAIWHPALARWASVGRSRAPSIHLDRAQSRKSCAPGPDLVPLRPRPGSSVANPRFQSELSPECASPSSCFLKK